MELMTDSALSGKTDAELMAMTKQLQDQAKSLGEEHMRNEEKIKNANDQFRQLLPNISECQEFAQKRVDQLEKKRRLERKIVAIINRYPGIIENPAGKTAIISNDISILTRQLDLINARKEKANKSVAELERKWEDLQRKMADIKGETRREGDILQRRQQDKEKLMAGLKKEQLDASNLYMGDGRSIDKKISILAQRNAELTPELRELQSEYEQLQRARLEALGSAVQANVQPSQTLAAKRQELMTSVGAFLDFWRARRLAKLWQDREEFLCDIVAKTDDRRRSTYSSIKLIVETNKARAVELNGHRVMISEMETTYQKLQKENKDLADKIAAKQNQAKGKQGSELERKRNQELMRKRDDLELACRKIEFRVRTLENEALPTKSERCFMQKRAEYRKELMKLSQKLLQVRELRAEMEQLGASQKQRTMQHLDTKCVLGDDNGLIFVQAASLDVLANLLFNPGNIDKYFIPGLLVLMHGEKSIEFSDVTKAILRAYEKTDFFDIRAERLRQFMDKLGDWFSRDMQDKDKKAALTSLLNLIGSAGIMDLGNKDYDDVVWDRNVPYNDREESLVFCATPEILVEHFSYYELQILRQIPAHEFMGTAWTAVDKWQRAPHIVTMMDHFNTVTQWIVESIVMTNRVEMRVRLIERWLKIMQTAREMGNFQLVFEIFGALCSPALSHLTQTMQKLGQDGQKIIEDFREFTTPKGRFENYRKELATFAPEVVVPYIGPMLTSLVYVADGNPSKKTIPDSGETAWNFSKHRSYAQIMCDICGEWGTAMKFVLNQDLFKKVSSIPPASKTDVELFELSKKLEGKD